MMRFRIPVLVACLAVVLSPLAASAQAKKYALLVGVNKYEHADMNRPAPLAYAEADVKELADLLRESGYEVDLLPGPKATRDAVAAAVKALAKKGNAEGVVLVAFAGHGVQLDKEEDAYYCPYDTGMRRAERDGKPVKDRDGKQVIEPDPSTLIKLTDIVRAFELSPAGARILLADCCRNDPTTGRGRGVGAGIKTDRLPTNTAVLLSCSHGQRAFEDKKWGHGAFFYHVLKGLRDGKATVASLNAYLEDSVTREVQETIKDAPKQEPNLVFSGGRLDFGIVGKKEPRPGEERTFDLGNGVKMRFCWVPSSNGKFKIGSPKAEQEYLVKNQFEGKRPDWLDGENEHEVAGVDGFWMAKYEMTQAQFVKLTGKKNPSYFSAAGEGKAKVNGLDTDDFPVEQVSWDDAQECIRGMKVPTGMKRIGLPSEAQWEWAARGGLGNGRAFYWGDVLNGDKANCDGNSPYGTATKGNYLERSAKVGSYEEKEAHSWGLCDMAGNVSEWCEDYYGSYERLPTGKNPLQTVKQASDRRVLRGGSWDSNSRSCRSANRFINVPDSRSNYFGFRVVVVSP